MATVKVVSVDKRIIDELEDLFVLAAIVAGLVTVGLCLLLI